MWCPAQLTNASLNSRFSSTELCWLGIPFYVIMAKFIPVQKYRDTVLLELKYIKEMVEKNETSLEKLNGRVRQNEQELERLKGISSVAGVIFTGFIAWLFKMKG